MCLAKADGLAPPVDGFGDRCFSIKLRRYDQVRLVPGFRLVPYLVLFAYATGFAPATPPFISGLLSYDLTA